MTDPANVSRVRQQMLDLAKDLASPRGFLAGSWFQYSPDQARQMTFANRSKVILETEFSRIEFWVFHSEADPRDDVTERRAFEVWADAQHLPLAAGGGRYLSGLTDWSWQAWQRRAGESEHPYSFVASRLQALLAPIVSELIMAAKNAEEFGKKGRHLHDNVTRALRGVHELPDILLFGSTQPPASMESHPPVQDDTGG